MEDQKLKRWLITCYLDLPAIQHLHSLEAAQDKRGKYWELVFPDFLPTVLGQFQLNPYWDPRMPQSEINLRTEQFNREIYPVWGKIWDTWKKTWDDPNCESELSILHRCDLLIKSSGITPNRLYLGDPQELRKKEAKAQKYGGQFQEAMSD